MLGLVKEERRGRETVAIKNPINQKFKICPNFNNKIKRKTFDRVCVYPDVNTPGTQERRRVRVN